MILLHEIGHTLGLAHPHGAAGLTTQPDIENVIQYTVMAYEASSETLYPASPMPLDIEALQFLYGPPANASLSLPDTDPYWFSIWPVTTGYHINFSGSTESWDIHLGPQGDVWTSRPSEPAITNSDGSKIWLLGEELSHVQLGSGNDKLTVDLSLFSTLTSFYLEGGKGNDTYVFNELSGNHASFTINDASGTNDIIKFDANITSIGRSGKDLFLIWGGGDIEIVDFFDGHVVERVQYSNTPNSSQQIQLVGLVDTLADGSSITDFSSLV
jgi:hypothetical protein